MLPDSSQRFFFLLLALTTLALPALARAGALRAGAARVDISPTADQFPFTAVGARHIAPYIGVHDPVYARALVLDDGATQVAILVVDVTAIPAPETFLSAVAKAAGLPVANILLTASQTHSVPLVNYHVDFPYQVGFVSPQQAHEIDRLRLGTIEAVRQAKAALRPARIAFGRGQAFLNINGSDPNGPSDKSLDLIRVDAADGTPIALLANYGVPSTVTMNNYKPEGGILVSADLFGAAAHLLESQAPKAPIVLFAGGVGGDQRPILNAALPMVGSVPAAEAGDATWVLLDVMARNLASATLNVAKTMPKGDAEVTISAVAKTINCPGARYHQDETSKQIVVQDKPPVPIPLNLIRINAITLAGVAGNVPYIIGQQIKAASPTTTLISGTAGSVGYILPESAYSSIWSHSLGGTSLKAGCAEKTIVQGIADLAHSHP